MRLPIRGHARHPYHRRAYWRAHGTARRYVEWKALAYVHVVDDAYVIQHLQFWLSEIQQSLPVFGYTLAERVKDDGQQSHRPALHQRPGLVEVVSHDILRCRVNREQERAGL